MLLFSLFFLYFDLPFLSLMVHWRGGGWDLEVREMGSEVWGFQLGEGLRVSGVLGNVGKREGF